MILFWILAAALLASAIFTITAARPVHSVVGLLANFAILAAMYLSLSAEFLAVIQILVYSGAILILFVFVIALLSSGVKSFDVGPNRLPWIAWPAGVVVLASFGTIVWAALRVAGLPQIGSSALPNGPAGTPGVFGSVADFGRTLFGPYLLPFEVTALILMVAVVGVVLLAGDVAPPRRNVVRRPHPPREPITKADAR